MLSFADALALLGVDSARVTALDRALGGALNLATGGASGAVLGMVSERGRIVGVGRDAVRGVGARLGRATSRAERTDVLRAAHAVIVIVAWFEALEETALPISLGELDLVRGEQVALAGGSGTDLFAVTVPCPEPHLPPEALSEELRSWYGQYGDALLAFLHGLAVWERASAEEQARTTSLVRATRDRALFRYRHLSFQLVQAAPEFGYWLTLVEHQATRTEVRRALDGIDSLLAATADHLQPPVDVAAALATAHEASLTHTILDTATTPEGIRVPTVAAMYLDPDFRVAKPLSQSGPADESWWERLPVRRDLTSYLAGILTHPSLTDAPLLVLGQPGAGKSVLTRVLAARLPRAGFLPVRIPLRDVRAEDELQDQIEQAIRAATGERTSWPELVRAAGGSTPVLLLDGFDELLQTTGVHHTDFLVRVARFQRREAELGRPVAALVTSRTAVADRARYPQGLVALRLEPFRPEQMQRWLAVWNEANSGTLRPLTWETVSRHLELASQPLLLTMLALYDATEGGLTRDESEQPLELTELYEELLSSFARRELGKTSRDAAPDDEATRVEQELQRLSLVAFALVNRGRQWVSADELDEDLAGLLGRRTAEAAGFRTPLGPAETALGRFFFVQRAQSVRDGRVLATFEFLHATFGEYLAMRLALRLLTDLLAPRPSLSLGESRIDDDLAYAVLSFAPLASRQMLRFARGLVRTMPPERRTRLAERLVRVRNEHKTRTGDPRPEYRPVERRTSSRHGIYDANLVLVTLALLERTSVHELFPRASDPVGSWHHRCLLWRSSMEEEQWTDMALSFTVRRTWDGEGRRSLEIRLREGALPQPEPLDANWFFRYPQGHGGPGWQRAYHEDIWHKLTVAGSTNDQVVAHALDPVFRNLGPCVTTFTPVEDAPASSLAHDLLRLLLDDTDALTRTELGDLYERVQRGIRALPTDFERMDRVLELFLVARDRDRDRGAVADGTLDSIDQLVAHLATRSSLRPTLLRHYPWLVRG
ncbi:NACHT domain-containing NTPase [Streptomyces sp. KL116D]|uniref:NACHT domain-containing protein n=1 Tax=Streptomyces sp. KL116D TaxID=3045152 RepID=UPI00355761E9